MTLAVAAFALLGGAVVYAALDGERLREVVAGVGVGGIALSALGLLWRWPALLGAGVAGAGAAYAVYLGLRPGAVDANAPLVAAALFAAAELAFWSLEPRHHLQWATLGRRLLLIALFALATAILGSVVLVASAGASASVAVEALGVLAAVALIGLVAWLAARAISTSA